MKSNLKLFAILLVLLTATYVWIERPDREWWRGHDESFQLKELVDNAQSFEVQGVEWKLVDNLWTHGQDLMAIPAWAKWRRTLTSLKLERAIPLTETVKFDDFITDGFSLKIDGQEFILGDKTSDEKGIYLFDKERHQILQMQLFPSDLFQMLDEVKEKTAEQMIEKRVFPYFSNVNFQKAVFETPGILSFELDLVNKVTTPKPIAGILQHPHIDQKFWHEMDRIQFTEQITPDLGLLYQKMAAINLYQDEKKVLSFELHRIGPLNADAVVYVPEERRMFKVQGSTAKVFFDQVQDYWDRKIIPRNVFKAFDEMRVQFILGDKEATVNVLNQEPLGFSSPDNLIKLKEDKLHNLFGILFNLGQYDEASRVSILTKSEKQQYQNEAHIRMNVFGQDLMLIRKSNELVVVNFTQGFKAHFILFDISIGDQWEDFFTS